MKKVEFHRKIRKSHRFLGLILGIQFLFWTLGGLYFSWSNMDAVKGDDKRAIQASFSTYDNYISPNVVLEKLKTNEGHIYLEQLNLIQILNVPFYQIKYNDKYSKGKTKIALGNAKTGVLKAPLSEKEAIEVARKGLTLKYNFLKIEYLTQTNGHHEYRNQPLPAYAITFDDPDLVTVYVSTELGTIQKLGNNKWRAYDILWMLHTMDFETRSNFSNWLLCIFSIFGVITVLSGLVLFYVSKKPKKIWIQ